MSSTFAFDPIAWRIIFIKLIELVIVGLSLSDAATIAEGSVGVMRPGMMMGGGRNMTMGPKMMGQDNNSHAVAAQLNEQNG